MIQPPVSHSCDSTDRIPIFLSGILPRVSLLRDSIGIVVRAIGSKPELYRVVLRAFACVHRVLRRVLRVLPLPRLSLGQFVRSGNPRGLRPHHMVSEQRLPRI